MSPWILARRNLRIFFRNRSNVFFSLLSPLILIGLYVLFLGALQVSNLQSRFPNATNAEVQAFVDAWVFAGITMITTLTTGLAALGVFVDDSASGRFKDFLVSPIRRSSIIFGYMISSFTVAVIMTAVVVALSQLYRVVRGTALMSSSELLVTAGYVVVSAAAFSALSAFVVTFLRSNSAFSATSTIVGTIIGFLAGAYIPIGTFPSGVVNVLSVLPFAQSAMLIRQPFTASEVDALTGGQSQAVSAINQFYGISLSVADFSVTDAVALAALALLVVVFVLLSAHRLGRRIR